MIFCGRSSKHREKHIYFQSDCKTCAHVSLSIDRHFDFLCVFIRLAIKTKDVYIANVQYRELQSERKKRYRWRNGDSTQKRNPFTSAEQSENEIVFLPLSYLHRAISSVGIFSMAISRFLSFIVQPEAITSECGVEILDSFFVAEIQDENGSYFSHRLRIVYSFYFLLDATLHANVPLCSASTEK